MAKSGRNGLICFSVIQLSIFQRLSDDQRQAQSLGSETAINHTPVSPRKQLLKSVTPLRKRNRLPVKGDLRTTGSNLDETADQTTKGWSSPQRPVKKLAHAILPQA
jgi:hypothetical protein